MEGVTDVIVESIYSRISDVIVEELMTSQKRLSLRSGSMTS